MAEPQHAPDHDACPWCCQWPTRPCTAGCPEHRPGPPVTVAITGRLPKESPAARAQRILRLLAD